MLAYNLSHFFSKCAYQTFMSAIRSAADTMDGALVAALKKLETTITCLTYLSPAIAAFVARFPGYFVLFLTTGIGRC